jgi:hypothetical protein
MADNDGRVVSAAVIPKLLTDDCFSRRIDPSGRAVWRESFGRVAWCWVRKDSVRPPSSPSFVVLFSILFSPRLTVDFGLPYIYTKKNDSFLCTLCLGHRKKDKFQTQSKMCLNALQIIYAAERSCNFGIFSKIPTHTVDELYYLH